MDTETLDHGTEAEVAALMASLPNVPYPANKSKIRQWKRDAIKAGYPTCDVCARPIPRSHWPTSIHFCGDHISGWED